MTMNDSFNNQYGAPEPPAGAHNAHNDWVPPAQNSPSNGNHAGRKFFDSIRRSGYFRSESRWVGGVAGGLARRLNMDPLLIRVVFVILGIATTGFALLVYAAAWALLPEERDGRIHAEEAVRGNFSGALVAIAVLAILGLGNPTMFTVFRVPGGLIALFWLALLAACGFVAWQIYENNQKSAQAKSSGSQPPTAQDFGSTSTQPPAGQFHADEQASTRTDPYTSTSLGATVSSPIAPEPEKQNDANDLDTAIISTTQDVPPTAQFALPTDGKSSEGSAPAASHGYAANGSTEPYSSAYGSGYSHSGNDAYPDAGTQKFANDPASANSSYAWVPPAKPVPAGKGVSFAAALGLFLVVTAGLLAAQATGALSDSVNMVALLSGAALTIGGLMVVINGFMGRPSGAAGGFAVVALIIGLITSSMLLFGVNITNGNFHAISDRTVTPTLASELEDGYAFGIGDFTLDLTQIEASELEDLEEALSVPIAGGIGDAVIIVPNDVPVVITSALGIGDYRDGDDKHSGFVGQDILFKNELAKDGQAPLLELEVNMGIGDLRIEEEAK